MPAVFEVCLQCNSACGYCDRPLNGGRYELTRQEIQPVFAGLYREGLRFVFLQGGEPLLRRDLPAIIDDLSDMGCFLTLITNGTKLTVALIERLAARAVSISIRHGTLDVILARFDQQAIRHCSDQSSCNMLCSRVVGSVIRHPLTALVTPKTSKPVGT